MIEPIVLGIAAMTKKKPKRNHASPYKHLGISSCSARGADALRKTGWMGSKKSWV
jgi:hypothetical protein